MASENRTEYKVVADRIVSPDNNINFVVEGNVYVGATQASNRVATIADVNNGGGGGGNADIADFTFEYNDEDTESTMTIHNHDMIIRTTRDDDEDADIDINSADDIWITANDDIELTSAAGEVRVYTGGEGGPHWEFRPDGIVGIHNNISGLEAIDGGDIKGRLKFDTNNGRALLQAYGNNNTATFTDAWDTATWTTVNPGLSQLNLTNASAIISFMNDTGYSVDVLKIAINQSVYGIYNGASSGDGAITFDISELIPQGEGIVVTEVQFQYAFSAKVDIDFDESELVIRTEDEMNTLIDSDDTLTLRSRSNQVRVQANNNIRFTSNYGEDSQYEWYMRTDGRFELPTEGYIKGLFGNSSDGNNYDTIEVVPDFGRYDNGTDQYLVIEPTQAPSGPGHIHVRAGGTIDASTADLILGGEVNKVQISDTDGSVNINANTSVDITSSGGLEITSAGDMRIESLSGNMNLFMDGGLYIGASSSENQILKRSDLNNIPVKALVPETASSTGTVGQVAWDTSYFYVCVATNTWKRTALSTW